MTVSEKVIAGLSGGRRLTEEHLRLKVYPALVELIADEYVTGACVGLDSYAGRTLVRLFPHARHTVLVPADLSRVDPWWAELRPKPANFQLVYMPPDTTYADRNMEIAAQCTELRIFPLYPEHHPRSRRSGTWQTARMAKSLGKPVYPVVLNDDSSTS